MDFSVECSNNVNAGTATKTITGKGDYAGTVKKTFEIVPKIVAASGAVQILEDQNGVRAEIDGEYTANKDVVEISDAEVKSVKFKRTFTVGAFSTIMLPFSIDVNKVHGAEFYKIYDIGVKIKDNEEGGKDTVWGPVRIIPVEEKIEANKPYLLEPTATSLSFDIGESVELSTSEMKPDSIKKEGVIWEIRGTYNYFEFGTDSTQLIRKSYGFAAKNQKNGLKVGSFSWTDDQSFIVPMRCYLVYNRIEDSDNDDGDNNSPMSKAQQRLYAPRMSVQSSIPETIDVEIVDENGRTTIIGKLETRTGEIHLNRHTADRWFDLQGRVLKGKPTVKGRYLHNGKIEIVK